MNDKSNKIFFCVFFVAGLIGLYYGYDQFVEPYILKQPSDTIGAPPPEWATEPIEPINSQEFRFQFRSSYGIQERKSGVIDLDDLDLD